MTRTATGNAILIRLVASTMLDGVTNAHELEAMYDTYDYDLPGMVRKIHDFIRKCGLSKVSKKTIKLAEIAVDYFNNTERKIEMTNLKDLYIPCPMCDEMMDYVEEAEVEPNEEASDFDGQDTVTYECKRCQCSITTLAKDIEAYATMAAKAHAIYTEQDDEPTPEEEDAHYSGLGNDEL